MNKTLERNQNGTVVMNLRNLKIICEREELYQSPENNETLYLHFKGLLSINNIGFDKIENLEPYVNLVALWLNNNALQKIEGLESLTNLISLFLNHNLIGQIENLYMLTNLNTLNLSHNSIKKIEGLETLQKLQNLNLSHNQLSDALSLEGLLECQSITNLDLSNNYIGYQQEVIEIFTQTNFSCLYLKANGIVRECPYYRKTMVVSIKQLQFLDDKPVTLGERKMSEAWKTGGKEAEQLERISLIEKKREEDHKIYLQTLERQEKGEMRANLMNQQQNLCKEIRLLQVLLDDGEDVEQQLEEKQNELKNVENELETYQMEFQAPNQCFMTTKDDFGNVLILNKTEEEAQQIKEKYFNEEMQSLNSVSDCHPQNLKIQQPEIQQENQEDEEIEQEVMPKVEKFVINLEPEPHVRVEDQKTKNLREWKMKREGWTKDHDDLLENLLMYHQFDFDTVSREFKRVMAMEDQTLKYLEPDDLKLIWTYIELGKYRNKQPQNLDALD